MREVVRAELRKTSASRLVALIWIGGILGVLLRTALVGDFVVNSHGQPIEGEFLAIWSAGQMAASGHATEAYNPTLLHQIQVSDTGHHFGRYYFWLFPPLFLPVAALLAQLPFPIAYTAWAVVTLAAYLVCVNKMFRQRAAVIVYGLSPAAFATLIVAQNGLLTAALFGGVLLTVRRKPIFSGLLLAALVVKPQLGLLVPVAFVANGHLRALATAVVATCVWVVACLMMFPSGLGWFLDSLAYARRELLTYGHQGWNKLQSVYGLLRTFGLGDGWATAVAVISGAILACVVFAAWRSRISFAMKSAILVLSSLAVTPYIYMYDFPLLTIALGFIWCDHPFDRLERAVIVGAYALIALTILSGLPLGLFAMSAIALLVGRRLLQPPIIGSFHRNGPNEKEIIQSGEMDVVERDFLF